MKLPILILSTLFSMAASAAPTTTFGSVYTDRTKDCVTVSEATDKAEIDFADYECKAFGGYSFHISGGDLRYNPILFFGDLQIPADEPGAGFWDTGSDKFEWVYTKTVDEAGDGSLKWIGFIYRLNYNAGNGVDKDTSKLFAIRLDGEKSCFIGTAQTNQEARKLVYSSKEDCK